MNKKLFENILNEGKSRVYNKIIGDANDFMMFLDEYDEIKFYADLYTADTSTFAGFVIQSKNLDYDGLADAFSDWKVKQYQMAEENGVPTTITISISPIPGGKHLAAIMEEGEIYREDDYVF